MQKLLSIFRVALLAIGLCYTALAMAAVTLKVKESSLGNYNPPALADYLTVSPDRQHAAYMAIKGDKIFVVVDGKPDPTYDGIGALVFSPDSQRLAYTVRQGKKWLMVVDGKPGPTYDNIVGGNPVFSPNSQHVAYMVNPQKPSPNIYL